jgi:hypothetical protein
MQLALLRGVRQIDRPSGGLTCRSHPSSSLSTAAERSNFILCHRRRPRRTGPVRPPARGERVLGRTGPVLPGGLSLRAIGPSSSVVSCSKTSFFTFPAIAFTVANVCILCRVFMPVWAMRGVGPWRSLYISLTVNSLKMPWVDTVLDPTQVINLQSWRDWPPQALIGYLMTPLAFTAKAYSRVTPAVVAAGP